MGTACKVGIERVYIIDLWFLANIIVSPQGPFQNSNASPNQKEEKTCTGCSLITISYKTSPDTQRLQKLIYLHLSTDCFMKISSQSTSPMMHKSELNLHEADIGSSIFQHEFQRAHAVPIHVVLQS